ncbi:MAG TPA: CapA family protein [Stellaceae bacterium]|jgi:poly-gamma-glutamate synthesis protein (capsule biosynthesis protein)|nr:CapA family protein [Stellaceae bacterium]
MTGRITILGCGDVGPLHGPMAQYGELIRPALAQADIRFAQVERVYSNRGALQLHSGGGHSRIAPEHAAIFTDCGFNVVSLASNHAMDWGADALLDTIELLRSQGLHVVGAGRDLADARAPAVVDCHGVRVAFLAYCSILHEGYEAGAHKPGVAPLRIHTYYRQVDYQPGIPPEIVTVPHDEDLVGMLDDIRRAKEAADVIVLSLHWGIHFIPRVIAGYQPEIARAAFAAGADLILGHHAHTPKAIGVHEGKACFYSLSNFIMSSTAKSPEAARAFEQRYGVTLDPDYPNLAYGADAKRSLVAKAIVTRSGVESVSFLPVLIDRQLRPEPLRREDPRFDDAVRFMRWTSEGFGAEFAIDGDEVRISNIPVAARTS